MKQIKQSVLLLVLAVLTLVVPAASAQDFTYGLSQEDFQAFTSALAQSGSQSDYSFNYSGSIVSTGDQDSTVTYAGEGAITTSGFQITLGGDITDDSGTQPYNTEVRFVDNTAYIQFASTWIRATEEDVNMLVEQLGPMLGGSTGTDMTDPSALMNQPGMMEAMTALQDLDPTEFTSIARSEEGDSVVYTTTVALGTLVENEGIQQALLAGLNTAASSQGGGSTLSAEDVARLPELLADSTVTFTHTINPSTNLVEGFSLAIALPLDPTTIGETGTPVNVTVNLDVTIGDYGTPTTIEVPAESTPLTEFMGAFMGGMSG